MRATSLSFPTCLILAATAGSAQAANKAKDEAYMRKVTHDYAMCVVRKNHAKASEAVLSASDNGEVMSHFQQLISADCLHDAAGYGVDAKFPTGSLQGALADALVQADFSTHGEATFANRLPLAQPVSVTEEKKAEAMAKAKPGKPRDAVETAISREQAFAWMARFGECVARENPEGARFWLLTPPDTPEETSRIKALQPAFGACLGSGTVKFNRFTVRNTVAINYYRLAMATVVSGAGSNQ
jgi:hypothetical protein